MWILNYSVDLKLFYAIFCILKLFYAMTSIMTSVLLTKWPTDLEHLVMVALCNWETIYIFAL